MTASTLSQISTYSLENQNDWQFEMQRAITDIDELRHQLSLPNLDAMQISGFPLLVPRPYLNRIQKGNSRDPLLLQVLPLGVENVAAPGYQLQPLQEDRFNPVPGLIHKYHSRVLLTVTGACAINCRYCFRRHFDYQANQVSQAQWQRAIDYIANEPSITEVIFSGGDPLMAPDKVLARLVKRLETIQHLRYLRIHTRLPIVIPSRVNSAMLDWLQATRFKVSVVLHCNHPQEIDEHVVLGIKRLHDAKVTLLNQSVLLKQVNDSSQTLADLSYALYDAGVLPYYLHLLDKVQGAFHFAVSDAEAIKLHSELLATLPGYLVPKLVREIPGQPSKTPIFNIG